MNIPESANISVVANVWVDPNDPENDNASYAASEFAPGDFIVDLIKTRDKRILALELTPRQQQEYEVCRFFYPHGHSGHAYENS